MISGQIPELKISIRYGKIESNLIVLFPILLRKEAVMGKSLNGKELGTGISQRKINKLETDNAKINTVISKEEKQERRVLTIRETDIFLENAKGTFYR